MTTIFPRIDSINEQELCEANLGAVSLPYPNSIIVSKDHLKKRGEKYCSRSFNH